MKKVGKEELERINNLLNDVDTGIVATKKGVAVFGNGGEILNLFSNIVNILKQSPIEKEDLKKAFEVGLNGIGFSIDKLDRKELDKIAKEIASELKNALEEVLGDDENE